MSGLTRCSGDPADTDISAVHAAAFIDPDLLLTQPPSSYQLLQLKGEDGSDPLALMRQQAQLATKLAATGCALPEPLLKALLLFALPPELDHLRTKYIDAEEAPGHPMTLATLGLVDISVGHISEARSVATWACVDVACNLD